MVNYIRLTQDLFCLNKIKITNLIHTRMLRELHKFLILIKHCINNYYRAQLLMVKTDER